MKEKLKQDISKLIQKKNYSNEVIACLNLILTDKMFLYEIHKIYEQKTEQKDTLKKQLTEVVLDFLEICLEDNIITQEELATTKLLKTFFEIENSDFKVDDIKERTTTLLKKELEKLYIDKIIDEHEALIKVDLQEIFELSYDDFYEIDKEVAQRAIENGAKMKDLNQYFDI